MGWVISVTPRPLFTSWKGPPVPIWKDSGWAPEPIWIQRLEKESFASAGDRILVVQSVVRHYTDWNTPWRLFLSDDEHSHFSRRMYVYLASSSYVCTAQIGPWPPRGFVTITFLRGWIVSPAPNPQPGGRGLRIYEPGDRVAQLYPQALGTHFSRLLRHEWVTVGLFFNPGHHTGGLPGLLPQNLTRAVLSELGNRRRSKMYIFTDCTALVYTVVLGSFLSYRLHGNYVCQFFGLVLHILWWDYTF
jgi:hypothetical protein